MIRRYISKTLVARKEAAEKWRHDVGPRVFKIMEKNKLESVNSIPEYCGDDKFEVRAYCVEQFRVDLNARTCDCNRWQLTGLPCPHAVACILSRDLQLLDYVHNWYKKGTFLKAYETPMNPMPGPNLWKKTSAIPPKPPAPSKLPGRPKKCRRKEPEEVRAARTGTSKLRRTYVSMTYQICGGKDHNRVGCPNKGSTPTNRAVPPNQRRQGAVSVFYVTMHYFVLFITINYLLFILLSICRLVEITKQRNKILLAHLGPQQDQGLQLLNQRN